MDEINDISEKITGKKPDDYYTEELSLADLRPGDILAFSGEGEDSILTKMILIFTNSWVSHGAMFYQHGPIEALADAGVSGIHCHKVTSDPKDRVAYVSRLVKKSKIGGKNCFYSDKDLVPVLNAARGYVEQDLTYPFADLAFLAMILLFKNHSKAGIPQTIIIGLLKCLSAELKKFLDEKYRHNYTMVCSSLVYQCYLDASKNNRQLKLKLNGDADLRCRTTKKAILNGKRKKVNTLLDLYAEHAAEYDYNTESFLSGENDADSSKTLEDWGKEVLECSGGRRVQLLKGNELSSAIEKLLKVLMEVLGNPFTTIEKMIKDAVAMQAMFVTPNDLCFNIENTKKIGRVHLERISDNTPMDQVTDYSKI